MREGGGGCGLLPSPNGGLWLPNCIQTSSAPPEKDLRGEKDHEGREDQNRARRPCVATCRLKKKKVSAMGMTKNTSGRGKEREPERRGGGKKQKVGGREKGRPRERMRKEAEHVERVSLRNRVIIAGWGAV